MLTGVFMRYQGGCHCGAIRYEVDAPEHLAASDCNCSICRKSGFLHLIVPQSRFRLLQGENYITTYTFNTGVARHTFCRVCGVKPFYIPRSNPDGVDVNVRCLDSAPSVTITAFDGVNWEQHAHEVAHLSNEI
jgi:hypothetical protein